MRNEKELKDIFDQILCLVKNPNLTTDAKGQIEELMEQAKKYLAWSIL